MKYHIKNKELEKLIFSIFDEKSVMKCISKQMPKSPEFVFVGNDGQSSAANATLRKEQVHLKPASVAFRIPSSEIEAVPPFTPDDWNLYPLVTPPEDKEYLVQVPEYGEDGIAGYSLELAYWCADNARSVNFWKDRQIVAFRELPDLYQLEGRE